MRHRITRLVHIKDPNSVVARVTMTLLVAILMLMLPGCRPIVDFDPVDESGSVIELERTMTIGCLEVEPQLIVYAGLVYEPTIAISMRNPQGSGEIARVAVDSLRLLSTRFAIGLSIVQMPGRAVPDTLVLQPGENAKIVLEYVGEWPVGYTYKDMPTDERLVARIAGIECGGEAVQARLLHYEIRR